MQIHQLNEFSTWAIISESICLGDSVYLNFPKYLSARVAYLFQLFWSRDLFTLLSTGGWGEVLLQRGFLSIGAHSPEQYITRTYTYIVQ